MNTYSETRAALEAVVQERIDWPRLAEPAILQEKGMTEAEYERYQLELYRRYRQAVEAHIPNQLAEIDRMRREMAGR
ncbi:MAG: hypothetical protein FJX76_16595 [Armatimonadetes bacterium]|nr:hypothetical protein [Armatimonadota bacterium]